MDSISKGIKATLLGVGVNSILAMLKISSGILGHSYALIADGIESITDVFSSLVVWSGLKIASLPPDENHPYGHGKAESLAAMLVSLFLLGAAVLIAIQSIQSLFKPQEQPAVFTLFVLAGVIITKECMFRFFWATGEEIRSGALQADACHHRTDSLTSASAFIGISLTLLGGETFESADEWAALFACLLISYNGFFLFRKALDEVMDAAPPPKLEEDVRKLSSQIAGVERLERCRIRKSGTGYLIDIHVQVRGTLTVQKGHDIGHQVEEVLKKSGLGIVDVLVHIEPVQDSVIDSKEKKTSDGI